MSRRGPRALQGQVETEPGLPTSERNTFNLTSFNIYFAQVLDKLQEQGISVRVASPKLVMEEAPESYKNVTDVVDTCHVAGISKKTMKLRPIAVIKG